MAVLSVRDYPVSSAFKVGYCFAFRHFRFLVLGIDTHTHTHTDSIAVSCPTPLNSSLCSSRQQNKTRKSECLSSGDTQSHFLGSAKLGRLLSRQSFIPQHQWLFLSHVRAWWVSTQSQDFRCHFHFNLGRPLKLWQIQLWQTSF